MRHSISTNLELVTYRFSSIRERFRGNFLEYPCVMLACSSSYTLLICSTRFRYAFANAFCISVALGLSPSSSITCENSSWPLRFALNTWEQMTKTALKRAFNWSACWLFGSDRLLRRWKASCLAPLERTKWKQSSKISGACCKKSS